MPGVLLAGLATLAAAFLQSATGMGLALVLGPALFALLDPAEALTLILLLGIGVNLLVLFGERGRGPEIAWGEVGPLLAASMPGVLAGAVVLDTLPKDALQTILGAAIVAALALRWLLRRRPGPASARPLPAGARGLARVAIGLLCGALTTTTNVTGPPLALWLQARGVPPAALRASLNACFLALSTAGTLAIVLVVGADRSLASAPLLAVLVPLLVLGYLLGRRAFRRLEGGGFEGALSAVVLAAGVASLLAGAGVL